MSQSISTVVRMMLLLGGEGTWRLPPPNSGPHGTQRCRGSCLAAAVSSHLRKWRSRAWQSPPVPRALPWEHPHPWPVDEETDSESSGGLPEVTQSMKSQQNPEPHLSHDLGNAGGSPELLSSPGKRAVAPLIPTPVPAFWSPRTHTPGTGAGRHISGKAWTTE